MSGFISTTTAVVIGAALLGLAAAGPTPANFILTAEEIRQVFQTDPHSVPEYEVTPIHWPKLHKRAADIGITEETATHVRLNAFGRDVPLWLRPIDGTLAGIDTPVYHARADVNGTDGVRLDKIPNAMSAVGRILEDKEKRATLAVKQASNGRQLVFGNIGSENWVIRPAPIRFAYENFSLPQILVDYIDNDYNKPHYHIIYKTPAAPIGAKNASLPISADLLDTKSSRSKRATTIPSIIYPEILVVVDYATYQLHNGDTNATLEYLLLFWNSVDLRYRSLEYPKVRLNIAGVIIEADPDTLPYIRTNIVKPNKLDGDHALPSSGDFRLKIKSTFPTNSSDVMITMSAYDMCNTTEPSCPPGTRGLAVLGGACRNVYWPYTKSIAVAIIVDLGGFDGVHHGAHELAHLFNANHDIGPRENCSTEAGYIMAPFPQLMENAVVWSPCTVNAFDTFFRKQESACLFNKPLMGSPMPRVLPGRLYTMDDQCMKIVGTKSCLKNPYIAQSIRDRFEKEICLKLRCYDKTGHLCSAMTTLPADGTICGEGMICLHAKCIPDPELSRTNDTKLP